MGCLSRLGIKGLIVLAGFGLMACRSSQNQTEIPTAAKGGDPSEALEHSLAHKIGLEACDEYIQKFRTCVSEKVTEESKIMLLAALEQSKAQWKQALAQGMDKATVEQSCRSALDTARQTMRQYQCEW